MKSNLGLLKTLIIKIELSTALYSPSVIIWNAANLFTNWFTHSLPLIYALEIKYIYVFTVACIKAYCVTIWHLDQSTSGAMNQ